MDIIKAQNLPTIPHTLVELIRAFEQPSVEFSQLAQIISHDPAITAKVYQLGKSVYFSQWRDVESLQQLLVIFGIDTVRHLSLLCATQQFFAQFDKEFIDQISTIWYRSVLCAHLAEELADMVGYPLPQEAYLAGLLHRIGQLVLIGNHCEDYLTNIDLSQDLATTEKNEQRIFAATSSDIGAALIRQWQICPFIADAILFQNQVVESLTDATALVRILHLSCKLCDLDDGETSRVSYEATMLFDLNDTSISQLYARAQRKTIRIISAFDNSAISTALEAHQTLVRSQSHFNSKLQQQVKNHALTNALQMSWAQTINNRDAFSRLRRDFYLLFGFTDLCFLLCGEDENNLCGYDDQGSMADIYQITINFGTSTSLALQALRNKRTITSIDHSRSNVISIADQQIKNLLGAKELCFIPLACADINLGVIVAAIDDKQWQRLATKKTLITLAAQLACKTLNSAIKQTSLTDKLCSQEREELKLSLRSVAHEINNPLSIINNYLHLLAEQLGDNEQPMEQITIIQEEIGRISTMVAGLKHLTEDVGAITGRVNINSLIRRLQQLLEPSLFQAHNQELVVQLDPELTSIECDGGSLKQVLINLLKNAAEALPQHGKVWINTHNRVYRNNSSFVEIEVCDNGGGISDAVLQNLFKPVVSTKKDHSGLGLTIAKKLVDQMQGEISCSSSSNGTRFQILLPRTVTHGTNTS